MWNDRGFAWYFNDRQILKMDKLDVKEPMLLHLGNWVSDFEVKDLVASKLPDDVEVDWVKIYK